MNLKTKTREIFTNLRGSFMKQEKWTRKRGEESGFSSLDFEDEVCATEETNIMGVWI